MRILKDFAKKRERVLITGASGFVGGHLSHFLSEKGYEVWGVFHSHPKKVSYPIRWLRANLIKPQEVLEMLRQAKPDYVLHFAGQGVPAAAWERPELTLQLNVASALYLFEAVARYAPKAKVVVASSSHVYGNAFKGKRSISESIRAEPTTPYGTGKFLMELAALNFVRCHGLDIRIVRAFNQVGTHLNPHFAFPDFCRQIVLMQRRQQVRVLKVGDVAVVRDFVHIRDAVRAYHLVMTRGKRGGIYNLGSGHGILLERAIDFLKRRSGISFRLESEFARYRKSDFPWIVSDSSKLRRLGWRPRESVWNALEEILEEYRHAGFIHRSPL